MVDNTTLNPGAGGDTYASDDIGGVKFQRVKIVQGADGVSDGDVSRSNPLPVTDATEDKATFRGRANTFRTPGRAGTSGQYIFALHNATGSTKVVTINQITVDLVGTAAKAVTVLPPVIRVYRFTALPTGGTALSKMAKDTALTSNASITALGDASADGTSSGSALNAIIGSGDVLAQEFAPRLITAAGFESADRMHMLENRGIVLRALQGIVVRLDYTAVGQNPITDMWIVGCDWYEV